MKNKLTKRSKFTVPMPEVGEFGKKVYRLQMLVNDDITNKKFLELVKGTHFYTKKV